MAIDFTLLGGGLAAAALLASGAYNFVMKAKVNKAESGQVAAQAVAGETVYSLVTERLKAVEAELTRVQEELSKVRDQLREKDNEVHQLRLHITDLEHCLRQAGIEPPAMRSYT
jgi:septal ring factor EnvC (AmiA/AmiB activator)